MVHNLKFKNQFENHLRNTNKFQINKNYKLNIIFAIKNYLKLNFLTIKLFF